ncbi:extracellular solute-binding protein [Aerococcus urinae]
MGNNLKNTLKTLLMVGLSCLILMACGGSEGGQSSGDGSTSSNKEVLTIGVWGGNEAEESSLDSLISNFEKQTGAKVEKKVYTDYNTQMQTDLIGGTAPDVFYVDVSMFDFFAEQGALSELNPEEFDAGAHYEPLIDAYSSDDTLYAVPKDMSTLSLYINTDMFEATGVNTEDIPTSYEELVKWLPEFQSKLDDEYGEGQVYAMSYTPELSRAYHLAERGNGDVITGDGLSNLSDPDVIDNLSIWTDLKETGAVVSPQDVGTGWNGEAFGTKKIAMMDEGNWVYESLKTEFPDINFTVKPMPTYKNEKGSMMFSVGWGKYSGTEVSDLADKWIKYVTGFEGQKLWVEGTGTLPSRQDVADAAGINDNPDMKVHLDAWEYASPWQDGNTLMTVTNAFNNYAPTVMGGENSWEEAMKQADEQANTDIKASN